jgi:hypothetical protein
MTSRLSRLLLAVGVLLMLALPAVASAHGGRDHDRGRTSCRAVQRGVVPRGLTTEQAQALATACTTRAGALKAAGDAFDAATASAQAAYRAAVSPLVAQLRTAETARRTACRADRHSQACIDARAAYRTTVRTVGPKVRDARDAYRAAVRPARETYRAAVRAAQTAFRTAVRQIDTGRS